MRTLVASDAASPLGTCSKLLSHGRVIYQIGISDASEKIRKIKIPKIILAYGSRYSGDTCKTSCFPLTGTTGVSPVDILNGQDARSPCMMVLELWFLVAVARATYRHYAGSVIAELLA